MHSTLTLEINPGLDRVGLQIKRAGLGHFFIIPGWVGLDHKTKLSAEPGRVRKYRPGPERNPRFRAG